MPVITRQYAPPTCTLEITAQISALSRWTRQPVVKSLDFLLSFEGLSDDEHQPIEVRGDRNQLESLSMAVNTYVQSLLGEQSPLLALSPNHETAIPSPAIAVTATPTAITPSLQPQSLLTHALFLGPLAANSSVESIPLKVSQLFDLVSALDNYAEEIEHLPSLVPQRVPAPPVWARAAGVLALLGGAAVALQVTQVIDFGGQTSPIATVKEETQASPPAPSPTGPSSSRPLGRPPARPRTSPALPAVQIPQRTTAPVTNTPQTSSKPSRSAGPARPQIVSSAPQAPAVPAAPNVPPLAQVPDFEASTPPPLPPVVSPEQVFSTQPTHEVADSQDTAGTQSSTAGRQRLSNNRRRTTVPPPSKTGASSPSLLEATPLPDAAFNAASRQPPPALGQPEAGNRPAIDLQGQVAEAQLALGQRWQVPTNLRQSLEYTVYLSPNGTIERVVPLGPVAKEYLGQTPLLTIAQPLVSPRLNNVSSKIRVVFFRDGKVKALAVQSP